MKIKYYFDYKSPYAFLADKYSRDLADLPNVEVEWLPYTLKIEKYLGAAELDTDGEDIKKTRNDHQWRRVRYSYYDCRREARRRGMTIRGPQKIFDSSLSHIAFLWAQRSVHCKKFHQEVFEKFWRRELDIENLTNLMALMEASGVDITGFNQYLKNFGRDLHDQIQLEAESRGVFGVPSWIVNNELFWGLERLERVTEMINGKS